MYDIVILSVGEILHFVMLLHGLPVGRQTWRKRNVIISFYIKTGRLHRVTVFFCVRTKKKSHISR